MLTSYGFFVPAVDDLFIFRQLIEVDHGLPLGLASIKLFSRLTLTFVFRRRQRSALLRRRLLNVGLVVFESVKRR